MRYNKPSPCIGLVFLNPPDFRNTSISYDMMGNILGLMRGTNPTYSYTYNGSQLLMVSGRLDPNQVLDTKFVSQNPSGNQSQTGVIEIDKNGTRTNMDIQK